MAPIYYLYLFVALFFLSGCNSYVNSNLQKAEKQLAHASDSSLLILQSLDEDYPNMTDKEKALFGLLYFQACDKEGVVLSSTELIDYSIDYFKKKGNKERLATSYFYRGRYCGDRREYGNAIQDMLKALELANHKKDHSLLGKIYCDLGQISVNQGENEKALDYVSRSMKHFNETDEIDNLAKMYLISSWVNVQMSNYDTAIQSTLKAIDLTADSLVIGDAYRELASIYNYMEKYDSTVYYAKQSILYPYFSTNQSLRYNTIANAYFSLSEYDSVIAYVNKAFEFPYDIYIERTLYRVLTNTYYNKNDKEKTELYLSKFYQCKDSIEKLEKNPNIKLIEEVHYSQIEKEKIKSHRLWLVILIIFILVVAGFIFYTLHKRTYRKETEVNVYKEELGKKYSLLLEEVVDEIQQVKNKYAEQRRNAKFEERVDIDKKVYEEVLHYNNESKFIDKMNRKLNALPEKLTKDYPEISYREIIWCCLFVLRVPTTEISMLLDYTQSSQYKFKQRLVKKLNLKSTKDLEELLSNYVFVV
ncbi:tetratricopeptide repeat protein [Bacteroides sp. 519]|uniref:tetratricopeptide repeat protein n=1 Tax=Bacteroides sp. 519 TaxID=2302937 RepID=UPI0013D6EBF5|nr:tetratricopeptide repeat protein [Bacteroides sp. 519]NDV56967.1 hypothetical protein [Bacteroides sp. 519]